VAAFGDKTVGGLYVAVGDAFGVGGVDFDGERQNQLGFDRLSADAVLHGQAVQKLHGDERSVRPARHFRRWCRCWDGATRRRPAPPAENGSALAVSWRLRPFVRQELHRDEAVQLDVLGLVDHTHAAAAENFYDAGVRNVLTDHEQRAGSETSEATCQGRLDPKSNYSHRTTVAV
jgi:hypothetical protein